MTQPQYITDWKTNLILISAGESKTGRRRHRSWRRPRKPFIFVKGKVFEKPLPWPRERPHGNNLNPKQYKTTRCSTQVPLSIHVVNLRASTSAASTRRPTIQRWKWWHTSRYVQNNNIIKPSQANKFPMYDNKR